VKKTSGRKIGLLLVSVSLFAVARVKAQTAPAQTAVPAVQASTTTSSTGGTIHGTVKSGAVPLPGVAITATNSVSGKKYATTSDVDGNYAMTVPETGRYSVRAELTAFTARPSNVTITADAQDQTAAFTMQLASRAADAQTQRRAAATLGRGRQTLTGEGTEDELNATVNAGGMDPSLANMGGGGDIPGADTGDSLTVQGQQGTTNGLANLSQDQIQQRINDTTNNIRQQGGNPQDQMNGLVTVFQGIMGGGGGPGGGGAGGGGRGGGGGGRGGGAGGGGGGFRNFNPAQPHGSIYWTGGNNALNSAPWQPTLEPEVNPSGYKNQFGASITGTPYIPGLTKPDTRQFVFINMNGAKNLNSFAPTPVRVPTAAERNGDFSQSQVFVNNALQPVQLYDPTTGTQAGPNLLSANMLQPSAISTIAEKLLNYYPAPNINIGNNDPRIENYQTVSNAGSDLLTINTRYQRQLGAQTGTGNRPGGGGGGFRGGGGGGGGRGQNPNLPPVLRQNINGSYNYSHSASDIRNIFLPLGGKTATDGNAVNAGYVISYGRLSNNAALNWNRSNSLTTNYFTNTATNPSAVAGLAIPNQASNFANPGFYNGLASIGVTNFQGFGSTTPSQTINQTISFSDFVAWRHKKHNFRFGGDIRRVHADVIGGNSPLGSYSFTGYATSSPADQAAGSAGTTSGSGFADFLLGLPQTTSIQAGIYKDYLRENVYDLYAVDDFRVKTNLTLNSSIRYDFYAPYTEKNNHLVNLAVNLNSNPLTTPTVVCPGQTAICGGATPTSLVNPDRVMFSPRFGAAWSPKSKKIKNLVIRSGYGVNYNTGQYATFAQKLSRQAPFAVTQNNAIQTATSTTASGCITISPTNPTPITNVNGQTTLTLANGFGCSTADKINNNWAVDKNYRLGMLQTYNLNIQKTFGPAIVVNIGYNGTKGSNLDAVGTPNATPTTVTTSGVAAFDYERSVAGAHSNALVVSVNQRQRKGLALGATYTYLHAIDNASGVGGAIGTPVQNFYRLDLEEGNSSFDQRHNVTGTWLYETPFGPNREFLNKGGVMAKIVGGFSISGSFTFGTGNYYTPTYSGNQAEADAANTFNQRPDKVTGVSTRGTGKVKSFFNTAAFVRPGCGIYLSTTACPATVSSAVYGTASQGSIEGPGTVSISSALSRTVQLGGTHSFEARVTAANVFNTVQYSGINTNENSSQFGQVTSAASMRVLTFLARYRF
jgi:trimeric autotransporter adhesin